MDWLRHWTTPFFPGHQACCTSPKMLIISFIKYLLAACQVPATMRGFVCTKAKKMQSLLLRPPHSSGDTEKHVNKCNRSTCTRAATGHPWARIHLSSLANFPHKNIKNYILNVYPLKINVYLILAITYENIISTFKNLEHFYEFPKVSQVPTSPPPVPTRRRWPCAPVVFSSLFWNNSAPPLYSFHLFLIIRIILWW